MKRLFFSSLTLILLASAASALQTPPLNDSGTQTNSVRFNFASQNPSQAENNPPLIQDSEPGQTPPKTDPPKTDPQKTKQPKSDPPKTEPPKTDPPKTNPPKTDPPKPEPPKEENHSFSAEGTIQLTDTTVGIFQASAWSSKNLKTNVLKFGGKLKYVDMKSNPKTGDKSNISVESDKLLQVALNKTKTSVTLLFLANVWNMGDGKPALVTVTLSNDPTNGANFKIEARQSDKALYSAQGKPTKGSLQVN